MSVTWTEEQLRQEMAAAIADLRVPPAPVDAVVRGGRTRRRRRTGLAGSAAVALAALPLAVIVYASGHAPWETFGWTPEANPPATVATQTSKPAPAPGPLPAPQPLTKAERDRLVRDCVAGLARHGNAAPLLTARTADGRVALVRLGKESLACWEFWGYSVIAGPFSKVAVKNTDPTRPVRTVDSGGRWDGRTWAAVLRVADDIAAVTVTVDGGPPRSAAVSGGWAAVAAKSDRPVPRRPAPPPKSVPVSIPDPLVRLTAFDAAGRVVWTGTSRGGYFGWVSRTHPNR